jgi:hypothetical protein
LGFVSMAHMDSYCARGILTNSPEHASINLIKKLLESGVGSPNKLSCNSSPPRPVIAFSGTHFPNHLFTSFFVKRRAGGIGEFNHTSGINSTV